MKDMSNTPSNEGSSPANSTKRKQMEKKAEVLDATKTARAICRAVNGKSTPHVPAIGYLKTLLSEHTGSEGYLIIKQCAVRLLESVLVKRNRADIDIWDVSADDIGQVKSRLVSVGCTDGTIRLYLDVLSALFAVAVKREVLRKNVVRKVDKPPRRKNSPRRPFTDEELQKVCDVADDEWFGMILFALYTGLRLGDVSRLVYRDLDLETNFIRANVKKTKSFEPKPIPPPLACYCKGLKRPEDLDQPLFPHAYGLVLAGNLSKLSYLFVKLLVKAGVRARGIKVRGQIREGGEKYIPLSFHCLRHNHTTMLKRAKIPEAIARKIAGHLSIAVSDVYTFLGEDIALAAVDDLPETVDMSLLGVLSVQPS